VFNQQFYHQYDQSHDEQNQAQAVDAMHVFDKIRFGPVWIWLTDVQVFGHLFQYAHKKTVS